MISYWTEIFASKCKKCLEVSGFAHAFEVTTSFSERNITITVHVFPYWKKLFMIICGKWGFSDFWDAAAQVDILPSSPKKLWLYHHDNLDMFYLYLCIWDLRSSWGSDKKTMPLLASEGACCFCNRKVFEKWLWRNLLLWAFLSFEIEAVTEFLKKVVLQRHLCAHRYLIKPLLFWQGGMSLALIWEH